MSGPSIAVQLAADRLAIATGMDTRSLDAGRLGWILDARRGRLGIEDEVEYTALLQSDAAEFDALIDDVVVQETRFFRDAQVFEHLRVMIAKLATDVIGPVRILSAPCGTGQEAYSLAALVKELRIEPSRVELDAVDISPSALETARRGMYGDAAVRHLSEEQRQLLVVREGKDWRVCPELRRMVRWERKNLAEPGTLGEKTYQLILCRNLFIYLHREARDVLAESLAKALEPDGRLVLGSADRVEEVSARFTPLRPAASFAFAHKGETEAKRVEAPKTAKVLEKRKPVRTSTRVLAKAVVDEAPLDTVGALYERAVQHRQMGNDRAAERRCRQALYLEPRFLPALELLQTLWHAHPNQRLRHALTARILRTRALQTARDTEGERETA